MSEEKEGERGFTVHDRRRFSETGELRREREEPREGGASTEAKVERHDSRAEISFPTFIISLSTQALMHLGEVPNPANEKVEKDLIAAQQVIDILGILREKTKGNLDQGEERLLENILFDLRMRYVEVVKKG